MFINSSLRMGAYIWKDAWGPKYHQSLAISLCALVISTLLALGSWCFKHWSVCLNAQYLYIAVIRQILVRENCKLNADEKAAMEGANCARVEEAARLEGITFEQAMERRKGYRYLY